VPPKKKKKLPTNANEKAMWEMIDALIATFERAGEIAPVIRAHFDEGIESSKKGATWRDVIHSGEEFSLIPATNDLIDDLMRLGAEVRRLVARRLHAEGMSMDEISRMFGVSRQRVSAIIRSDTDPTRGPWRTRRSYQDDS
jgi:predicted XRE-type DNA-binding protein